MSHLPVVSASPTCCIRYIVINKNVGASERQNYPQVALLHGVWPGHSEISQWLIYNCSNHSGTSPLDKNISYALVWKILHLNSISLSFTYLLQFIRLQYVHLLGHTDSGEPGSHVICGLVNKKEPWTLAAFSTWSSEGCGKANILPMKKLI